MSYIEPSFEIDDKGRVICQFHSKYPFFVTPEKDIYQEMEMEKLLTCKTCVHYKENDCYFPKEELDEIEKDRTLFGQFLCKLCGNKVDRMLTVIQKLYFKERLNIEIPLICCNCYDYLTKNRFRKESRWDSLNDFLGIITSILLIPLIIVINITFSFIYIAPFIYPFIVWYIFKSIRKFILRQKGRRYYNKKFYEGLNKKNT